MKTIKLPHHVIVKAPGLLPMLYKPSELAIELGIPVSTLKDWLHCGAPHQRDDRDHIWINGLAFAIWVEESRTRKRTHRTLQDHEGYCLRCNEIVELNSITIEHVKGKLVHIRGICIHCGGKISRGGRLRGQSQELPLDQTISRVSC